jgi:hypothetical protein
MASSRNKFFTLPVDLLKYPISWNRSNPWAWTDILLPFLATRLALFLAGWYAAIIPINHSYPHESVLSRGWQFTSIRLVDMWGRWDSGWYIDIIRNGYLIKGDIRTVMSNIEFFPLYPWLIKFILLPFQASSISNGTILLIGILVSNVFLLAALFVLYNLTRRLSNQTEVAKRTILYLLIFPTSFFFSAFYPESTFLFFEACALYFAVKGSWKLANICGVFLALTRPTGFLILLPLFLLYIQSLDWNFKRIRTEIFWFFLIPAGIFMYLAYLYRLTGDFFAPLNAEQAWGRSYAPIWQAVLSPQPIYPYLTLIEQIVMIAWILLAIYALFKLPSLAYGVYAIALIIPEIIHGALDSTFRYNLVILPTFVLLGLLGRNLTFHKTITAFFFALMVIFMALWSQFYWIA